MPSPTARATHRSPSASNLRPAPATRPSAALAKPLRRRPGPRKQQARPAPSALGPGGPTAFHRLTRLHEALAAGRAVSAAALAAELELSPRTIKRDIERLRDFHQAPITYDRAARAYRYTAPFDLLTGLRLDADEALALVLAGRSFAAWSGSPLGRTLAAALGKIAQFAGSAVSVPAPDLRAVLTRPDDEDPAQDAEQRHFARLLDQIVAAREIEILYHKASPAARPERRRVRPLHLAYLEQRWVLVADDPARGALRKFLLSRIRDLTPLSSGFTPPPRERVRAYLAGSLGRFTGETLHEVRLRFDATAAPYLRERPWHASQILCELPDGGVEVTLRLNNLIDVRRRVLSNGRHVEVLTPPELRSAVAEELAVLARVYAPDLAAEKTPSAP